MPENLFVNASPSQDASQPASPSLSSLQDVDEPLTPRMEVDSRIDTLSDSFDTSTDALGSSPARYSSPLDGIYAMSSTVSLWPGVDVPVANNVMQDEGEFDHYHKQIMASRDPSNDFFVLDDSIVW